MILKHEFKEDIVKKILLSLDIVYNTTILATVCKSILCQPDQNVGVVKRG
jgi:hypothetical protein